MLRLFVFVVLVAASQGRVLLAQAVRVKIVDGRSGRPLANRCLQVWVGNRSEPGSRSLLQTQTNGDGVTTLHLSDQDSTGTSNERLACGIPGTLDPVVKNGDTISVRVGYVLCQSRTPAYTWLVMDDFPTKNVLEQGAVTANTCGRATALPTPGEIVIFVRPLSWWEKMKQ